jgi:asparagine synthase (glutamine-hydrolysing)
MEHFIVSAAVDDGTGTGSSTARFAPARDGKDVVFLDGVVFRLSASEPRIEGDPARAVLARIKERGPAALADMVGDFVACVVTELATYAFKSFTSQYQLYVSGRTISNRLALVAPRDALTLDEDYFARHVLLVPGMQFHMARTPVRGVTRVLPGELVTFGRNVSRTQLVKRHYRYRLDRAQRREDVAPEIVRILRESVRDHLASPRSRGVCVELSGGLDSSFVACLVGEAQPGAKAVMFSRPDIPSHRQSEDYARSVADRYGLDLHVLAPSDLPEAPSLSSPPYGDEPSDFFWFGDLFSRAVAALTPEGGAVFTGFGADQLFLRSSAFLPYLLGRRELREFAANLGPVAKLISRSRVNLALQSGLSQIPRGLFYKLAKPFAGRRFDPLYVADVNLNRALYEPVPWLPASAEQETFDAERIAAERRLVGDGIICDDWGYFAAPRAVAAPWFDRRAVTDASPYCDLRLIDFVYDEVSALLVHDFEGRYKELLREAQKGIVPEDLRARKNDMFVFNSFLTDYLAKGRDELVSLLDEIPDGFVDPRGVRQAFEELRFGVMNSSTRSLIALFGYLTWRRAFLAELAELPRTSAAS